VALVTVGKGVLAGSFAEADRGVDLVFCSEGDRLEGGAEVRVVTEGLRIGQSAGAVPVLFARLQFHAGC
jgi:hypothetical protein